MKEFEVKKILSKYFLNIVLITDFRTIFHDHDDPSCFGGIAGWVSCCAWELLLGAFFFTAYRCTKKSMDNICFT